MKPKPDAQRKIDVHAHYLPPGYADEMRKAGMTQPDGMPDYPQWSPQLALEKYDEFGIETAILDVLHADGIGLKTNALGIYLGDTRFDPIFPGTQPAQGDGFHPSYLTDVLAGVRDRLSAAFDRVSVRYGARGKQPDIQRDD